MFVQSADGPKVDPAKGTFRLVNVNPQALYFSDRPYRVAGHITMSDDLKEWPAAGSATALFSERVGVGGGAGVGVGRHR
jgi:hypothetical protein